jgi:hypothetical protein
MEHLGTLFTGCAALASLSASPSSQRGPLKNPSHIGKQGNISQLGGDFILGPGMHFHHPNLHTSLNQVVRRDVLIYVSDEAYRGSYVLTELQHLFLTSIIIDIEVSELMKAAGVAYP